jgi:hypothetical protein
MAVVRPQRVLFARCVVVGGAVLGDAVQSDEAT